MGQFVGPGGMGQAGPTSNFYTSPFPHAPGERARDREGNEYMFVDFTATVYFGTLVQITSTGQASPLLGTTAIGSRVGVVVGGLATTVSPNHPTSDHGGWVQIYGVHPAVQTGVASGGGASDSTVGFEVIPQTSVGTPSGVFSLVAPTDLSGASGASTSANIIHGMWLVPFTEVTDLTTWPGSSGSSGPTSNNNWLTDGASQTSGANTSAFIGQTYAVFLNYPYVTGNALGIVTGTS